MNVVCVVCNRSWPKEKCQTLTLTDEEKAHIQAAGEEPMETLSYCNPCWKILSDKLMGAQLIKGTLQVQLRAKGVANAEELSQTYFERLLALPNRSKMS